MKKIIILIIAIISIFGVCLFSNAPNSKAVERPYYCESDFVGPLTIEQNEICKQYGTNHFDKQISFENSEIENVVQKVLSRDTDFIYKDFNGKWHGVINISYVEIVEQGVFWDAVFFVNPFSHGHGAFSIEFTRELEQLETISIEYRTRGFLGIVSDWKAEEFDYFDFSVKDFFFGEVWRFDKDENNKKLFHVTSSKTIEEVKIISFDYVLTNEEVDNVMADIQVQYDSEVDKINDSLSLTLDGKKEALRLLDKEYERYEIEYGEVLTSDCVGEQCYDKNESNNVFTNIGDGLTEVKSIYDDFNTFISQLEDRINIIIYAVMAVLGIIALSYITPVLKFVFSKYGLIIGIVLVLAYFYYQI